MIIQSLEDTTKEDIVHLLSEIWFTELNDTFYIIFYKQEMRWIDCTIEMSKADLEDLGWKEDNGEIYSLTKSDIGCIHTLHNHIQHLNQKANFL